MPFDFDVAMDVLEKLTEEERSLVLKSLSFIPGPATTTMLRKEMKYCMWASKVWDMTVTKSEDDDVIGVRSYRGSFQEHLVRKAAIYEVRFKASEGDCFGMLLSTLDEKQKKEQKQVRQAIALDSLEFVRKERDIL